MDKKEDNQVRANFRNEVFKRDKSTCIVPGCDKLAADAHHIIERALWKDLSEWGGYFKENGASLCAAHHIDAEHGFLTPTALRTYAGIHREYLPKRLVPGFDYDKWGRELKSPSRWSIKYPHTPYLTISPGFDLDDVREMTVLNSSAFLGMPIVITRKMDGSNIFFDSEKIAARNGHDATHASFDMAKSLHAVIREFIPEHIQIFCEWLYAKHSIHYTGDLVLNNYCHVFAVYNRNTHEFLSWHDVKKFAIILGIPTVPVVSTEKRFDNRKEFDKEVYTLGWYAIKSGHEGVVVRNAHSFHHSTFWQNVGKFVRPNHVSTSKHWMNEKITRNEVRS